MTPAAISTLTDLELFGWCKCVFEDGFQAVRDGERAAVIARAKVLKLDVNSLPGWRGSDTKKTGEDGATNANSALDIANLERRSDDAR